MVGWAVSVSGASDNPECPDCRNGEVCIAELISLISGLAIGEAIMIAEFGVDRLTRWEVRIDRCGTPRVTTRSESWATLSRRVAPNDNETEILRFLAPQDEGHLLLARGGADIGALQAGMELRRIRGRYARARLLVLPAASSVDGMLGQATARVPLSQWYELVVLERSRSGRLHLAWEPLFEPGSLRGATRTLRVRCEPSGPAGTTFAVVARNGARPTGLVSMMSAKVPAGTYTLAATLRRPGTVSFDGLPDSLREDSRGWTEIFGTVPERLTVFEPVHLIVAVETCGSADQVTAHLDRADQLIRNVANGAEGPLRFSLLTYDSHPHDPRLDDDPVTVLAWAARDEAVLAHLAVLREQAHTRRRGRYTHAASIECMLAEVASLLQSSQPGQPGEGYRAGRPVLVTVGTRVAFPASRDPRSEILPCPAGHDWVSFFHWLAKDHGSMTFGAICGGDPDAEVWQLLGKDASAELVALDAWQFAADLRLLRPVAEKIPFPMADQ
jgi:hypothetical protein